MTLGQKSEGRDLRNRYAVLGLLLLFGLLVLAIQLYRLQVVRHHELLAKSEANYVDEVRIRADRGLILDARGDVLVDNRPSFDVFIKPAFCTKCAEEVLPKLATLLRWDALQQGKAEAKVKAVKRSDQFRPVPVAIDVARDQHDALLSHLPDLPGVEVEPVQHRRYPLDDRMTPPLPMLAHVLGYMNEVQPEEFERLKEDQERRHAEGQRVESPYELGDFIGRAGLERYFEKQLRGIDGMKKRVVDAHGKPDKELDKAFFAGDPGREPIPGHNLRLSIDMRLQHEAESAFPGTAGAVVAMDVRTGFILAMVSRPAYDPNELTGRVTPERMAQLKKDPLEPMIFRPVQQHYSPGSTFKVVTGLAALRSGLFKPSYSTFCTGGYRLGSRVWRCWNDKGHGPKDARGALQHSCDTYYYKVADVLGLDPIAEVGRELGLGAPTGIGVVYEVSGIMPNVAYHNRVSPGGYQKGMALNSAIGQGDDNVTPLQLTLVYASIANGGMVYQPQLVRSIERVDGDKIEVMKSFEPKLVRNIHIDPEHRQVLVEALSAVVNEAGGTAYGKRLLDIKVAGKTGTAQVKRLGSVRLKTHQMDYWDRDHAWFASFAPVEDPEIAVVVLNEHGGHGGSDAAPTAMAVIRKYFDLKSEAAVAEANPSTESDLPSAPRLKPAPPKPKVAPAAAPSTDAPQEGAPPVEPTQTTAVPPAPETPPVAHSATPPD